MSASEHRSPPPVGGRAFLARWPAWILMGLVVVVALGFGATKSGSRADNALVRQAAIERSLRCPSCEAISVADSSAPAALSIRRSVHDRIAAGESDSQIKSYMVSRYGPGILLTPSRHGFVGLVWLVPLVALVASLFGVGYVMLKRRSLPLISAETSDEELVRRFMVPPKRGGGTEGSQA